MNDLEICKRIAEIEGLVVIQGDGEYKNCVYHNWQTSEKYGIILHDKYNPLTDDALNHQIMIKYKVRIHWLWEENDGTPHYEAYINEDSSDIKYDKSPNKAICLAIIEAHNES